jgi:hypothetical protein
MIYQACRCTATVAIRVIRDRANDEIFDVPQVLHDMLKGVEGRMLPALEPLVRLSYARSPLHSS